MYLLAIKSLLSFVPKMSVVVHSDGSLTEGDFSRIARHVSGVTFVRFEEAERRAGGALATRPLLAEWRLRDAAYRRLVDIELWRTAEKVIILDSDVLTNRDPVELDGWIDAGVKPFLLGQSPVSEQVAEVPGNAHVQMLFLQRVPDLSRTLGYPAVFLQGTTAGFCGYRHEISLDRIETALRGSLDLGLPMEQWGGDQCLIIYLLSAGGAERLPQEGYLNFEPTLSKRAGNAKMVHFYGTHRFHKLIYPRLASEAVRRLAS